MAEMTDAERKAFNLMLGAYKRLLGVSRTIEEAAQRDDEYVVIEGRVYTTRDMFYLMLHFLKGSDA